LERSFFYTEDEIGILREELTTNIKDIENEMEQLDKDLEVVSNEAVFMSICNRRFDLKSLLETYKMKIGLINSGYRGATEDYITGEVIYHRKDK
jgi:hypothetical protein